MERCIAREAAELPALFERQQPSLRRSLHSIRARGGEGGGGEMREVQAAAATRAADTGEGGVAVHNGFAVVLVEGRGGGGGGLVHAGWVYPEIVGGGATGRRWKGEKTRKECRNRVEIFGRMPGLGGGLRRRTVGLGGGEGGVIF